MAPTKRTNNAALKELRAFGLAYPGAHTKSPWPGHLDLAVKDKTFAYLSIEGQPLSISCKLPDSHEAALLLPFTKPTAYGLGKSGWVSAEFDDNEAIPLDMLKAWIDESYRAQAPKRLVATLPPPSTAVQPKASKRARSVQQRSSTASKATRKAVASTASKTTKSAPSNAAKRRSKAKRSR